MGFSLQSGQAKGGTSSGGSESLDIYNPARISKRWEGFPAFLNTALEEAETGVEGATRVMAAQLFKNKEWRKRYPQALTDGAKGKFAKKLLSTQRRAGALNLSLAFQQSPGTSILDYYVQHAILHENFPAALLPGAQKRFVRWLFDHGQSEQGFTKAEILCFLQLCEENKGQVIATSYLLQPEWQARFPAALTRKGAQPFLEWLDETFNPISEPLDARNFPPPVTTEINFPKPSDSPARRAPFNWRHAGINFGTWFARKKQSFSGINVLGPFCYSSGLGQATRTTARSLQAAGLPVSCRDIPASHSDIPRCAYLGLERFPATIIHSVPDDPGEALFRHVGWPLTAGKYRIGVWYWELETILNQWTINGKYLDEVWAPTRFIADAARKALSIPVVDMLPAVQVPRPGQWSRKDLGIPENRFVFLFIFDMMSTFKRKNPLALIEAWRMVARRETVLVIKVSRGSADPASYWLLKEEAAKHGVLVIDEVMPVEKAMALIQHCDCYVSLHRSEGFGLTMAEAMLMDKPVIGTRYSGNLDFMNDGNSLLVDCGRVPVGKNVPIYPSESVWAEPSTEHAAEHMRWVLDNRDAAMTLGKKAGRECAKLLSPEAYGRRMLERFSQIEASRRPSSES